MYYDVESNIINIELTNGTIVNAIELGNFIIHLSVNNTPVLIEILNASKYKTQLSKIKDVSRVDQVLPEESLADILKKL